MTVEIRRDIFQAIADPKRRKIIDLLATEAMTPNALAEKFDISRPAVSQHIKILSECGVVEIEQRGRERYYRIKPQSLVPAFLWFDQLQKQWEERIVAFEQYVINLRHKHPQNKKRKK